jgi:hypothetical protein
MPVGHGRAIGQAERALIGAVESTNLPTMPSAVHLDKSAPDRWPCNLPEASGQFETDHESNMETGC